MSEQATQAEDLEYLKRTLADVVVTLDEQGQYIDALEELKALRDELEQRIADLESESCKSKRRN
jgi:cell division protein FtsB